MSRKKPVKIDISKKITVQPEFIFQSEVVKAGGGGVVKAYKKFIGKRATVIIHNDNEYPELEEPVNDWDNSFKSGNYN